MRPATAQPNIAAAAKAFSLGQQAELAGNPRAASEHYELADRMVPSPEALRSAARARLKAGDEAIAATLAEALERRYSDQKSRDVAEEILAGLRPKLARVELSCRTPCSVVVDGGAIGVEEAQSHVFYVESGRHTIGGDFGDGVTDEEVFDAQAGKSASLDLSVPETARAPARADAEVAAVHGSAPPSQGLRIGWFIASATVTAGLAAATIWSGLDVLSKNEEYEMDPTPERLADGQRRQRRTNILIGLTAAAAVTTGVVAWKTRWSGTKRESISSLGITPADGGAVLAIGGRFP